MSTGSKLPPLPALPPQTGCIVCGDRTHGVDTCARFLATNPTPMEWRKAADNQIKRDRKRDSDLRLQAILARIPAPVAGSYDDRMSASIQADVDAQLRATKLYRGAA